MTEQDVLEAIRNSERLEALRLTGLLDTGTNETFDRLTQIAIQVTDAPIAFVSLIGEDHQFIKSYTGRATALSSEEETTLEYSFCKHTVAKSSTIVVDDTSQDPRFADHPGREAFDIQAYVGVPLTTSDDHTLGSFCIVDEDVHEWSEDDVQALQDLAALATTEIELRTELIERKALESELKYRAHHDDLTELVNRDLLWQHIEESLDRARRHDFTCALFYLDLDHFKAINDHYGHVVGDQLLRVVARRLESEVRATDTLARLGGDEFVGWFEDVGTRKDIEDIARRFIETLDQPISVEEHTIEIDISLGVALYSFRDEYGDVTMGEHLHDPQTLIRRADTAMYQAKKRGNTVEYVDLNKSVSGSHQ